MMIMVTGRGCRKKGTSLTCQWNVVDRGIFIFLVNVFWDSDKLFYGSRRKTTPLCGVGNWGERNSKRLTGFFRY